MWLELREIRIAFHAEMSGKRIGAGREGVSSAHGEIVANMSCEPESSLGRKQSVRGNQSRVNVKVSERYNAVLLTHFRYFR